MNATSTDFAKTFPRDVAKMMIDAFASGTKMAAEMIWGVVRELLAQHWLAVIGIVLLILFMAFAEYLFTGRWKMLGQVLYRIINWGSLLAIVSIFGLGIFTSDWADIYLALVGIASYLFVGWLLRRVGIR
ncbi:MAG TPA: hypothetical protein VHE10_02600 [Candidatus Paceibacterota bacterium]|nr:hypothetical protein [Candidatus Paceibacterota bacterium]